MAYGPPLYGIFWGHIVCKYGVGVVRIVIILDLRFLPVRKKGVFWKRVSFRKGPFSRQRMEIPLVKRLPLHGPELPSFFVLKARPRDNLLGRDKQKIFLRHCPEISPRFAGDLVYVFSFATPVIPSQKYRNKDFNPHPILGLFSQISDRLKTDATESRVSAFNLGEAETFLFPIFPQCQTSGQDFRSCYRTPGPQKGFRRVSEAVSEGVFEGFSKGFRRGQPRTLQNPSKRLQEPFKNPSGRCRNR